jgi:serine/threonine-protein kinase
MTTTLAQQQWSRVAEVFGRVLDAADAAERAALLDQLCGSDATIRREVEEMLAAHDRPGLLAERRFVVDGIGGAYTAEVRGDALLPEGARVGPYRVESLVGAGGMGDVYRARRVDGLHSQIVAVKVLRDLGPPRSFASLRMTGVELVRRFRIEREALARLVHPGIATILDGGSLEDGRPYIVLQFVDGVPVTTYCATHDLSLRDRLALFARVVDAVQFAHGRLVVHRDIKPSNVLVDGAGAPRLLDFGIAKLLDARDDESLGATAPELHLFTPDYAAPEQFRGEPPTTATDVYALGVLLFELVTGRKPFASRKSRSFGERAVDELPPPAPSSVAASPADARRLRGDVDTIVLTAMRTEPERRYASAQRLGDDIDRFLTGRPIKAGPDSVRYRVEKFVRRNRELVVGAAAVALLTLGFAITSAVQARRIARERDRAEQERASAEEVLGILTGLFERGNPNTHPGGDTLRVTSLLDSAESAVSSLANDPTRQAALWHAVGRMRMARGEYARGLDLLTRAFERRRAAFGPNDVEAARIHHDLAKAVVAYRGEGVGQPMLDTSFHELEGLLGEKDEEVRGAMNDLLGVTTDSVAAQVLLARLMALEHESPSTNPIAVAELLNTRALERLNAKRYGEAVALLRATLDIVARQLPPEHEDVRTVRRNLAAALGMSGNLAQAESMQRADVALEVRLHTSDVATGIAHEALALTLVAERRPGDAEREERAALQSFRAGAAPEHWRIWSALRNLAFIAAAQGRVGDGLALLDSAIALASGGRGSFDPAYLRAQRVPFLIRLGRLDEAARTIARSERDLGTAPTVSSAHRGDINRYAGMVALASGDARTAAERFGVAVTLIEPSETANAPASINTCLLGVSYARLGRIAEARPRLARPCARYESGSTDPLIVEWIASARRLVR